MSDQDKTTDMPLFWRDWTVPKDGYTSEQNEDACSIRPFKSDDGSPGLLIAGSDGATEAIFSRRWARELVGTAQPDWPLLTDEDLSAQLQTIRRGFTPISPDEKVPYYVRNKFLAQGSQATLLVLRLTPLPDADSFALQAVAVGDCCLVLFRSEGEVCSFPMESSDEFGVNPSLIASRPQAQLEYKRFEASVRHGDLLLVCTDAVARYFLQRIEENEVRLIIELLIALLSSESVDPEQKVEEAFVEPASRSEESKPVEITDSETEQDEDVSLLDRLKDFFGISDEVESQTDPAETAPQVSDQPGLSDSEPKPPLVDMGDENEVADPALAPEADEQPISRFEEFIDRCRTLETKPMRNDDSTLVLCVPVESDGEHQPVEVREILKKHLLR